MRSKRIAPGDPFAGQEIVVDPGSRASPADLRELVDDRGGIVDVELRTPVR